MIVKNVMMCVFCGEIFAVIKYTLVKELEKRADISNQAAGNWMLASLNAGPINRMVKVPTLTISKNEMTCTNNTCFLPVLSFFKSSFDELIIKVLNNSVIHALK